MIDSEEIVLGFDPASALSTPGPATWVDFTHNGEETGDFLTPYNTLFEGLFFVPNGGTIRVLGGGSTPLTGVLDKPARIESINGTLTIGQ